MAVEREKLVIHYTRRGWRFDARCPELGIEVNDAPGRVEAEERITLAIAKHLDRRVEEVVATHLATEEQP